MRTAATADSYAHSAPPSKYPRCLRPPNPCCACGPPAVCRNSTALVASPCDSAPAAAASSCEWRAEPGGGGPPAKLLRSLSLRRVGPTRPHLPADGYDQYISSGRLRGSPCYLVPCQHSLCWSVGAALSLEVLRCSKICCMANGADPAALCCQLPHQMSSRNQQQLCQHVVVSASLVAMHCWRCTHQQLHWQPGPWRAHMRWSGRLGLLPGQRHCRGGWRGGKDAGELLSPVTC
jgi:hypothetical protein